MSKVPCKLSCFLLCLDMLSRQDLGLRKCIIPSFNFCYYIAVTHQQHLQGSWQLTSSHIWHILHGSDIIPKWRRWKVLYSLKCTCHLHSGKTHYMLYTSKYENGGYKYIVLWSLHLKINVGLVPKRHKSCHKTACACWRTCRAKSRTLIFPTVLYIHYITHFSG